MFFSTARLAQPGSFRHRQFPNALICVTFYGDGPIHLARQLKQDVSGYHKQKGPRPFSLFELMDMRQLIPGEIVNSVITHRQRRLLAQYVQYQLGQAKRQNDSSKARLYDAMLDELLPRQDTQIIFSWPHFQRF